MRVVITSRGFAEKGEFQGSSSPNDPESILREAGFEVVNLSSAGFGAQSTENEIFEALKDADAAIVGLEPITESLIRRLPKLRAVTRRGIGYDSVDIDACRARGITVMRTTGAVEGAVAEHVMAYLLYFARRLARRFNARSHRVWRNRKGNRAPRGAFRSQDSVYLPSSGSCLGDGVRGLLRSDG